MKWLEVGMGHAYKLGFIYKLGWDMYPYLYCYWLHKFIVTFYTKFRTIRLSGTWLANQKAISVLENFRYPCWFRLNIIMTLDTCHRNHEIYFRFEFSSSISDPDTAECILLSLFL